MFNKNYFLLFFIITISSITFSYDNDKDKPIFLESNCAKWDETSQKSTYVGNVTVTQGSILMKGNLLIVTSKNNKIDEMLISGDKSTYTQTTRTGKIVYGEAKKIQYDIEKSTITFLDEAELVQSNNTIKSNKIIYKTDKENIIAGDNDGKSRVKMILEPKKNNE